MGRKGTLLFGGLLVLVLTALTLQGLFRPSEMSGLRIACNDDAAGLLIQYMAAAEGEDLEVVNMSFQQLQDCCSSQTELALSAGNFDLALLCPDGADKLIASGQPYQVLGPVVCNANVLVTNQDIEPQKVGYMNAREIQKNLIWENVNESVEMMPVLPAGLPYALERKAVEGIVLDILSALKIDGYQRALPSADPATVLVAHQDLIPTPELAAFINRYNLAVDELIRPEILKQQLAQYLSVENGDNEVEVWRKMGVQFQAIEWQSRF